ncbi:hypothetical protein BH09PSE5_BH09PSE5_34880 [soil metagenome]
MQRLTLIAVLLASSVLAGCDMLGIETPDKIAAVREAEGKAVGGACRHAARAIEDCFTMNKKADKAAVFAGWREMNDYMRENKIDPVSPQGSAALASASRPPIEDVAPAEDAKRADKAATKQRAARHDS